MFCNKLINQIKCYSWLKSFEYRKICYHMPRGSQIFYQLALLNDFPVKIAHLIGFFVQLQNRNSGRLVTQLSFRINCHIIYSLKQITATRRLSQFIQTGKDKLRERKQSRVFPPCIVCAFWTLKATSNLITLFNCWQGKCSEEQVIFFQKEFVNLKLISKGWIPCCLTFWLTWQNGFASDDKNRYHNGYFLF